MSGRLNPLAGRLARWWVLGRQDLDVPLVTVVRLHGILQAGTGRAAQARRLLNVDRVETWLARAFYKALAPAACAICINSPGGSPAQSELIHGMIRRLSNDTGIPVSTFAEDVAASGGYWLMCAGDKAYACETSLVGSVGVVSSSFGAVQAAQRLGIERRLYTAGDQKVSIDPFLDVESDQEERLRDIMEDMHASFQRAVKTARGGRLKGPDSELFSGRAWTGRQAAELGLVDGVGTMVGTMREQLGARTRFLLCSEPAQLGIRDFIGFRRGASGGCRGAVQGLASLLPGGGAGGGGGADGAGYTLCRDAAEAALDELEERALWARYRVG